MIEPLHTFSVAKPHAGLSPVADTWRTSSRLLAEGEAPSLLLWHPRQTQALAQVLVIAQIIRARRVERDGPVGKEA